MTSRCTRSLLLGVSVRNVLRDGRASGFLTLLAREIERVKRAAFSFVLVEGVSPTALIHASLPFGLDSSQEARIPWVGIKRASELKFCKCAAEVKIFESEKGKQRHLSRRLPSHSLISNVES